MSGFLVLLGSAITVSVGPVTADPGVASRHIDARAQVTGAIYALKLSLDSDLIHAVIRVESNHNARAVSSKGAMGLMQLMPATARALGVTRPFDPAENIRGGVEYLRRQIARFGRVDLALAAYNAGPEAVERYGGIPPYRETRDYVRRVMAEWARRRGSVSAIAGVTPQVDPASAGGSEIALSPVSGRESNRLDVAAADAFRAATALIWNAAR